MGERCPFEIMDVGTDHCKINLTPSWKFTNICLSPLKSKQKVGTGLGGRGDGEYFITAWSVGIVTLQNR